MKVAVVGSHAKMVMYEYLSILVPIIPLLIFLASVSLKVEEAHHDKFLTTNFNM